MRINGAARPLPLRAIPSHGNLLFVGIGAGNDDGGLVVRAGAVLGAFLVGTAVGARLTGSRLVPGVQSSLARTPLLEASLLAAFALWLATGSPAGHATAPLALLVVGAAAVGLHAAIALAFHLPNVAIATEAVHARG